MRIGFGRYAAHDGVSDSVKSMPSYRRRPVSGGFRCDGGIPAFAGMTAIIVALFIAVPSFAETTTLDRKTVSSKAYVDTSVETRQEKIPAAGTNSANAGTTVVMYTTTGNGTIGERGIYDNPASYTAGTDANKLVTASALKGSVTNLPTMETSKLTCANPDTCSLWTIEDQQVYGDGNNNNNSSSSNNNNNNN